MLPECSSNAPPKSIFGTLYFVNTLRVCFRFSSFLEIPFGLLPGETGSDWCEFLKSKLRSLSFED